MTAALTNISRVLASQYGPFAFGIVSFLALFYFAVLPILQEKSRDDEVINRMLSAMEVQSRALVEVSRNLDTTAESSKVTAMILEKTVERIER